MNARKTTMLALLMGSILLISAIGINMGRATGAVLPREDTPGIDDSDDDDDGIDDGIEQMNQRIITVQQSGNEMQIESTLKNGENQDQLEIKIKPESEGLGIDIQYHSEANAAEIELGFEVRFRKIVEYIDTNANGIYDTGVDTFVKEYSINSFAVPVHSALTIANTTVHYIHVETNDGVFGINAYIPEEFAVVNGSLVTPTQVKIDILITGFAYDNGASDLALYTRLSSEQQYESDDQTEDEQNGFASGEEEVQTSGGAHPGIFSWATTADIDGISKPVKSTALGTDDSMESEQKLYICYPRGDAIVHDPKVGVAGLLQLGANYTWIFIVAGIAAAAVVVGVVIAKKRR